MDINWYKFVHLPSLVIVNHLQTCTACSFAVLIAHRCWSIIEMSIVSRATLEHINFTLLLLSLFYHRPTLTTTLTTTCWVGIGCSVAISIQAVINAWNVPWCCCSFGQLCAFDWWLVWFRFIILLNGRHTWQRASHQSRETLQIDSDECSDRCCRLKPQLSGRCIPWAHPFVWPNLIFIFRQNKTTHTYTVFTMTVLSESFALRWCLPPCYCSLRWHDKWKLECIGVSIAYLAHSLLQTRPSLIWLS